MNAAGDTGNLGQLDERAFGQLFEAHRRDVVLLAYRLLGSLHEAEEVGQETALRAWRAREGFRGDAAVRTWLRRIATRICLDLIAKRPPRVLPFSVRSAAGPDAAVDPPAADVAWLEPVPGDLLLDAASDPAARYSVRESVSLAFLAALQTLPARQRAVLILRDVLAWSAAEVAAALDVTVGAANSLLHRARTAMRQHHHALGPDSVSAESRADPIVRHLLDAYVRAWETDDVDALVWTLKEDVRLAMPPSPSWYATRGPVVAFLRRWVFGRERYRLWAATANGSPAFGFGAVLPSGEVEPRGVQVLRVDPAGIGEIDVFIDPAIAARFWIAQSIETTR